MNRPAPGGGEGAGGLGLAIVGGALLIGLLVAVNLSPGGGIGVAATSSGGQQGTQAPRTTTTAASASTTSTIALKDPKTVRVLPANATGTSGASTKVADALKAGCWAMQRAVDATAKVKAEKRTQTIVYTKPGFEREAASITRQLGLREANNAQLPAESPVPSRGVPEFDVLVLVAQDLADSPPAPNPALPCAAQATTTRAGAAGGGTTTTRRSTTSSAGRTTTTRAATTSSSRVATTAP